MTVFTGDLIRRFNLNFTARITACSLFFILSYSVIAYGVCEVDISDEPMETKAQSAPSNIMFVLDNSGSMDWEFMTPETSGIFQGEYYIYPDSAFINGQDRVYGDSYILAGNEQKNWTSQWSGYNKIFYKDRLIHTYAKLYKPFD